MTGDGVEPCILPWVGFATNPFGKSRPCGYSSQKSTRSVETSTISREFNGEVFKEVRREFMAGRWPKNCERCRYMEQGKVELSKRAVEKTRVDYSRLTHLIEQTRSDGSVEYYPREIDIRLGTICNLKCIHCGTGNSSKWLEDKDLLGQYPNTQLAPMDNSWVDRQNPMWDDLVEHIHEIERFNFIGGEPFASRQHNRFIEFVARTPFASRISLHYVTNGALLSDRILETLAQFQKVTINVSLDATGPVLSYFRFPLKVPEFEKILHKLENQAPAHFDLRLQWTSSNVSTFYLDRTLEFYLEHFSRFRFSFCNFVDYPAHMSPQNLPHALKEKVVARLSNYMGQFPAMDFYLKHMMKQDLWSTQGATFLRYVSDLDRARNLNWRENLAELAREIEAHA